MRTNLEQEVWWRVDLGEIKSIYDIKVFYRNDRDANGKVVSLYIYFYNAVMLNTEIWFRRSL